MYSFIALIIITGFIAYIGDILGRWIGRKRLTIFGLRPKKTAILITIITGMLITILSIFFLSLVSEEFNAAIWKIDEIRDNLSTIKNEYKLQTTENKKAIVEITRLNRERRELEETKAGLNSEIIMMSKEILLLNSKIGELNMKYKLSSEGELAFKKNEVLGYLPIHGKGDPEIIVNELKKLIKDIRNMAKNMGFKVRSFEDAWTPLKEGIIKFVESLDEKSDLIFVLRTTKRLVKGETLEFNLKAVDNKVLYIKGDILEGEVDGSLSRQKIKQQVETIYKEISEISKKNGMIVDPMSNLDNLALYDLTNEIKRRNRKLVLEFVIDADVYLNGPFIYSLNLKAI